MINRKTDNLFDWSRDAPAEPSIIVPWKPEPLAHDAWPPDYKAVYAWRIRQLQSFRFNPKLIKSAKAYYSTRPGEFILHWIDTYDPRKTHNKWIPFVFFTRQIELVEFLHALRLEKENGLVEKCRDAGATWICCAYSVWSWLFIKNDAIGWGSRKEELVDLLGDPSSIFEKMRLIIRRLPMEFKPDGLTEKKHLTFRKIINPANGAVITGEAGDNIGRGGRTSMYFKDESAHYERPEKIEAALGDNTNVQVDISSVNGLGNVFHRRREAGVIWKKGEDVPRGYVRIFIIDWRDHPEKTQVWYDDRKARYVREGMEHLFAQEVDRNYSAAVQNTIIPFEWIESTVDAHLRLRWIDSNGTIRIGLTDADIPDVWGAGLDVADEGFDRNALALRQFIIWRDVQEWGERDPGVTTRRSIDRVRSHRGIKVQYDSIGVGASVKAEYNRLRDDDIIKPGEIILVPWNAGAAVKNPYDRVIPDDDQSTLNRDFFKNFKAQAWWNMRTRVYKTHMNVTQNIIYPLDEMISLDSRMTLLQQVKKELAQPTRGQSSSLQMVVNKKPDGTKSPNLADAGIQMFFPVDDTEGQALIGSYG